MTMTAGLSAQRSSQRVFDNCYPLPLRRLSQLRASLGNVVRRPKGKATPSCDDFGELKLPSSQATLISRCPSINRGTVGECRTAEPKSASSLTSTLTLALRELMEYKASDGRYLMRTGISGGRYIMYWCGSAASLTGTANLWPVSRSSSPKGCACHVRRVR